MGGGWGRKGILESASPKAAYLKKNVKQTA